MAEDGSWEKLLRKAAKKSCWEELLRKAAEKSCWEELLRRAAENSCWEELLRKAAENSCWERLLRRAAEKGCWKELLRRAAEKSCWEKLLRRAVEKSCWERRLFENAAPLKMLLLFKISSLFFRRVGLIGRGGTSCSSDAQNCDKCKFFTLPKQPLTQKVIVGRPKLWWNANKCKFFTWPKQPLTQKVIVERPKLWWNANSLCARTTLSSFCARWMSKTVAKCKFLSWTGNLFVTSRWSDVRNLLVKRWFLYAAGDCWRHALTSCIFAHAAVAKRTFWHFGWHAAVAKRTFWFCRMNPLVGFGGPIVRNCCETQILSSWNCSAHWPGRVNVCVLYLHDSSAHCICYHNLLNMVVPENLPRG